MHGYRRDLVKMTMETAFAVCCLCGIRMPFSFFDIKIKFDDKMHKKLIHYLDVLLIYKIGFI